jgi:hypothetical protein
MIKFAAIAAAVLSAAPAVSVASPGQAQSVAPSPQAYSKPVCKYVLAADPRAQPYELCQSSAQWTALEASYAKDANRMVCHYEDTPGTRVAAHKVCGPRSAWEARRQESREMTEKIQMQTRPPGY